MRKKIASVIFILAMFALIGVECDSNPLFFVIFKLFSLAVMLAAYFIGRLGEDEESSEERGESTDLKAS